MIDSADIGAFILQHKVVGDLIKELRQLVFKGSLLRLTSTDISSESAASVAGNRLKINEVGELMNQAGFPQSGHSGQDEKGAGFSMT